jgi:hypothetical protein
MEIQVHRKQCFVCHRSQALDDFPNHPGMTDGHLNRCKECMRAYKKEHRARYGERIREYEKRRAQAMPPHRRAVYARQHAKYIARHPKKWAAIRKVNTAVAHGHLVKAPCVICGSTTRIHGHHDNYEHPLDVVWLCHKHHLERHCSLKRATQGATT